MSMATRTAMVHDGGNNLYIQGYIWLSGQGIRLTNVDLQARWSVKILETEMATLAMLYRNKLIL